MRDEDAFLQTLLDRLTDEERRGIQTRTSHEGWQKWYDGLTDPWARFGGRFAFLRWAAQGDAYARLERDFAAWLEGRNDPRGEVVRIHHDLRDLGRPAPAPGTRDPMADAFLLDVVANPDDEVPLLIFADWLEEHGDPRARHARLLARARSVRRALPPNWGEGFDAPWPPLPSPPVTYERFSDPSRRVMHIAHRDAGYFNHEYVDSGHLLLSLLSPQFVHPSAALADLGVTREAALPVFLSVHPIGPDIVSGRLPYTPRVKGIVHVAIQEAGPGRDALVEPECLLLGLCLSRPCPATHILGLLGTTPAIVCRCLLMRLGRDALAWLHSRPEVW